MVQAIPKNSVWSAMGYMPPHGRCNYKTSLMSPACPCLRFMLHPVRAATSFECDGCNHHASFHSLENPAEDETIKLWAAAAAYAKIEKQASSGASKKRPRITEKSSEQQASTTTRFIELPEDSDSEDISLSRTRQKQRSAIDSTVNLNGSESDTITVVPAGRRWNAAA